jgi:hypothetical protein
MPARFLGSDCRTTRSGQPKRTFKAAWMLIGVICLVRGSPPGGQNSIAQTRTVVLSDRCRNFGYTYNDHKLRLRASICFRRFLWRFSNSRFRATSFSGSIQLLGLRVATRFPPTYISENQAHLRPRPKSLTGSAPMDDSLGNACSRARAVQSSTKGNTRQQFLPALAIFMAHGWRRGQEYGCRARKIGYMRSIDCGLDGGCVACRAT